MLVQILLDEPRTEMHVYLDQGLIPDAGEAVDFPGLDHQDITRAGLELLPADHVAAATPAEKLHFIIGMPVGAGSPAGQGSQQEHRDADVAVLSADELMRAALEGEFLLADTMHD
jgi:hypothetical protein